MVKKRIRYTAEEELRGKNARLVQAIQWTIRGLENSLKYDPIERFMVQQLRRIVKDNA